MASVFVNPEWITVPGSTSTEVYVSGNSVYNSYPGESTPATCYSTLEEALEAAISGDTVYIYNSTASPLSLSTPSGTYSQQLSDAFYIEKNLYVRAGVFQVESVEYHTYSFNIIDAYTVDFGVTESFNIAQKTVFNVWNGANFQLGSTGSGTSVSFENSGKVYVSNGATFQAGTTSITNNVEIEVTGSAFSVASVTNTGNSTFKVEGTSKLEIGMLSGTITLNNENVTLNASSITGGNISATAYGAIFTGANTLNGVALNATGKTVTVGNNDDVPDSLTVKGTSSLKIGTLSGTIKTDANELTTLNASSISGGSISAQNNLAFTGANTLNGVALNATGKTVTVGNTASLTVEGTSSLKIGTLDGTIKTDANALTTLNASSISGGSISAQNNLKFTGANTLNGVTLNAAGNNVTVNDTLTLDGTSSLNASNITGSGSISVLGCLIFTGANTLNGVALNASGKTVTVETDEDDSLTVGGMSTLKIGTLDGTILTDNSTTLKNSNITGGAITASGIIEVKDSTISSNTFTCNAASYYYVSFSGTNTLNSVTLDATEVTVGTVEGDSLTVSGTSTLSIGKLTGTIDLADGATIQNSGIGVGNNSKLRVKANNSATFSTTSDLDARDMHTTIENSGTINVNGKLNVNAITNNGTIALNGGSKLTSGISGGSITTSDTGTVTLKYSTVSSSAFTATADEVIFSDENTLSDVTFNATAENTTVKANNTLTVGGTSTLNIGTLDGTIKTGSAGTTLNNSHITGGGTNGGTITALGNLTFTGDNTLRNISLDALDQTVDTGSSYSLRLGGAITLKIGTLISSIQLYEDTTFTNSTISNGYYNNSRLYTHTDVAVTFAGANTIFDASVGAKGLIYNNGITKVASKNDVKGELSTCYLENGGIFTVGSDTDACSLTVTELTNGGGIFTVIGKDQNNLSSLTATSSIANGKDYDPQNSARMSLTYSELNATTLTNYAPGEFRGAAGLIISNSTLNVGSLQNGKSNNTSATINISNCTVTADSVTNYSYHNVDPVKPHDTGTIGFAVTNSTFDVGTFTNSGKIEMTGVTLRAASVVNSSGIFSFQIYGTNTLEIGLLTGNIHTASSGILKDTSITGGGTNGGSITAQSSLTFTGANTLNSIMLDANDDTVTIGNSDSLTVKGTSSLRIASLDGTIKTDSAAATTLNISNITNGTITAQNSLTFTGTNTLNSVVLNAADQTVTIDSGATLTINAASTITAGSIIGSGSITINAAGFSGTKKIIDLDSGSEEISNIGLGTHPDDVTLYYDGEDYWLRTASAYVNTAWTPAVDDDSTNIHYGQNAFSTVQAALAANLDELVIDNGTFEASGDNVPTFNGVTTTISGGSFSTSVCGGKRYTGDATGEILSIGSSEELKNIQLTITGGSFAKSVFVGDRMDRNDYLTRYGDLSLTIEGGSFSNAVAGGGTFASSDAEGGYTLHGDVYLTIQGGTFINDGNKSWIYGGCLAANKVLAAQTNIYGTVTVTIDASDNDVSFSNLVVGSFGTGKIIGSTKLVLTGSNNVTAGGDIWGGCGKDYYTIGGNSKTFVKKSDDPEAEDGDRMLSFTGFNGTLDCSRIRDFTSAEFIGVSTVELNKACDMRYISNWEFENGSTLSGSSFLNDFTGDTFMFSGSEEEFSGADVLTDVGASALTGFAYEVEDEKLVSGFSSVKLFGYDATWNGSNAYVTDTGSSTNYKLYLNNAETPSAMLVGIA